MDNLETGGGEEQKAPQTGHAMLKEGLVNCLALNKKGIFTAGKVCIVMSENNHGGESEMFIFPFPSEWCCLLF